MATHASRARRAREASLIQLAIMAILCGVVALLAAASEMRWNSTDGTSHTRGCYNNAPGRAAELVAADLPWCYGMTRSDPRSGWPAPTPDTD